jgi:hypothetical protein
MRGDYKNLGLSLPQVIDQKGSSDRCLLIFYLGGLDFRRGKADQISRIFLNSRHLDARQAPANSYSTCQGDDSKNQKNILPESDREKSNQSICISEKPAVPLKKQQMEIPEQSTEAHN